MKKTIIALLVFIAVLLSCKSGIESRLSTAENANGKVISLMKEQRILFLAENHASVNPILFLTENIEEFYNDGLRYLVLEGITAPADQVGRLFYFYPWENTGWKLERQLLDDEIERINAVYDSDPITVIWGEDGFDYGNVNDENIGDYFQKRDEHIFRRIAAFADAIGEEEKILIFYGGSHGSQKVMEDHSLDGGRNTFDWSPFSCFLKEKYGDDFTSIDYRTVYNYFDVQMVQRDYPGIIDDETLRQTDKYSDMYFYDYYIFETYPVYGINYQYDFTRENFLKMIGTLRKIDSKGNLGSEEEIYWRASDRGQFLIILYYLKCFFGENFDFTFWNCENSLAEELDKLERRLQKGELEELLAFPRYSRDELRLYHGYNFSSLLTNYYDGGETYPQYLRQEMVKATDIIPEDMWPHYWIAFSWYMEEDFEKAKKSFDDLLNRDLVYSMEILPVILEQQIRVCREIGAIEDMEKYQRELKSLTTQYSKLPGQCNDMSIIFD